MMAFRLSFTLVFLGVMVLANYVAGTLTGLLPTNKLVQWGISHDAISNGEIYRLVTGTFLSHDLGMFLRQFVFAASVIGFVEWTYGSVKAALLFFGLDIAGTAILLALLAWWQPPGQVSGMFDVGMSIGGFALVGLILSEWPAKWLLLAGTLVAIATKFLVAPDLLADVGHCLALLLGFAMAGFISRPRPCVSGKSEHAK